MKKFENNIWKVFVLIAVLCFIFCFSKAYLEETSLLYKILAVLNALVSFSGITLAIIVMYPAVKQKEEEISELRSLLSIAKMTSKLTKKSERSKVLSDEELLRIESSIEKYKTTNRGVGIMGIVIIFLLLLNNLTTSFDELFVGESAIILPLIQNEAVINFLNIISIGIVGILFIMGLVWIYLLDKLENVSKEGTV